MGHTVGDGDVHAVARLRGPVRGHIRQACCHAASYPFDPRWSTVISPLVLSTVRDTSTAPEIKCAMA